jgi:hypothetical protein
MMSQSVVAGKVQVCVKENNTTTTFPGTQRIESLIHTLQVQ